jgi:hypothetical protein
VKKIIVSFIIYTIFLTAVFAQEQKVIIAIPVEFMAGNNRFDFQTQINKGFSTKSKFDFLSITSSAASYNNDVNDFDFINTSQISYNFYKNFGISSGISMNVQSGFSPTAGLQYVYAAKKILIVIAPGILLTNNHNIQGVSVFEFKPDITHNWKLYSRLQGFYNHNSGKHYHQRSYVLTRFGLTYNQVGFGVGGNWDWYGQIKLIKENYGIFVRYSFL